MTDIFIPFPDELREKAEAAARERGIPLDEFVRLCVSSTVNSDRASDPLFSDKAVYSGEVPSDLSQNHDGYLYEADDE